MMMMMMMAVAEVIMIKVVRMMGIVAKRTMTTMQIR